ncbi:TonB-dependent receptor [Flavobacterium agricola]|uniref:TonB-dependent receptor n=1 Tax=Flavobacterium agricola TaxID=2870839 RepID=A0ABY6LYM5_9FLAO|nr:TonB-dependent receptor [Flavobacterium agricola]UYW01291.1 TonB-dependent receptor [Flavobacterium agricola]
MKINVLTIFTCLITFVSFGQKATISGKITDGDFNNEPLPFASVSIKNTSLGISSDDNGKYSLSLEPGNYVVQVSYLGYITQDIPVKLVANENKNLNVTLFSNEDTNKLEDVVITVENNRQKETALLAEQRKAVEIKTAIGSQELSRKGVSDASAAVAKVSGVQKTEGSSQIYVRGLGDRYNSSYFNGLPISSNDPEYKNIDLGLFNTDVIQLISIDKTFNSGYYGDFGGASIDIVAKKFSGKPFLEVGIGSNINTNAIGRSNFYMARGFNEFGFNGYHNPQANTLSKYEFNRSLNYNFQNPIAGNVNVMGGTSFFVGNEGRINVFATANMSNGYGYRGGYTRSAQAQGDYLKSLDQEIYSYNTNTTAMTNVDYKINSKNNIAFNYLFVNSSSLGTDFYRGFIRDLADNGRGTITRSTYTQNQLNIFQLLGNHKLTDRIEVDWAGSYNKIRSFMPDRSQQTSVYNDALQRNVYVTNSTTDNHRYFQNLSENEFAGNLSASYKFAEDEGFFKGKLTVGYNGRVKKRDFDATQYNFRINSNQQTADIYNYDGFFNAANFNQGLFAIRTYSGRNTPQFYKGDQDIHAGYANVTYKFSDKLDAVFGVRYEKITQNVNWLTQLSSRPGSNDLTKDAFLPSLVLKYALKTNQNLRFAASKTYTLPQFKERALFIYEDVTEIKVGNPFLYASDNYNVDLKWEVFPTNSEVLAVTAFGKYIKNPINEITLASSTNDISFINTGDYGIVYGVELEARKNILDLSTDKENKLSGGLNVSYMKTTQTLDSEKVRNETDYNINLTHNRSAFTGASDLILNADLTYFKEFANNKNILATVTYNYFSDKIYALGTETKGNLVDKGFGTLDFIFKTALNNNLALSLTAKNILNPKINRVQENADRDIAIGSYTRGSGISLGLNYTF